MIRLVTIVNSLLAVIVLVVTISLWSWGYYHYEGYGYLDEEGNLVLVSEDYEITKSNPRPNYFNFYSSESEEYGLEGEEFRLKKIMNWSLFGVSFLLILSSLAYLYRDVRVHMLGIDEHSSEDRLKYEIRDQ